MRNEKDSKKQDDESNEEASQPQPATITDEQDMRQSLIFALQRPDAFKITEAQIRAMYAAMGDAEVIIAGSQEPTTQAEPDPNRSAIECLEQIPMTDLWLDVHALVDRHSEHEHTDLSLLRIMQMIADADEDMKGAIISIATDFIYSHTAEHQANLDEYLKKARGDDDHPDPEIMKQMREVISKWDTGKDKGQSDE